MAVIGFVPGRGLTSVLLIVILVLIYIGIRRSILGKVPKIRPFPAVEAIPEAVGRAAEMGKPIHLSEGFGAISDSSAPMTIAGLAVLGYVAEEAVKRSVPIRFTVARASVYAVVEELMKSAYARAGKPQLYNADVVNYVGETQNAVMAGSMGYIYRETPAASFLFGATFYETITILGSAAVVGAFQIAGTPRVFYQPYVIVTCDYTLILDELYAAAAAITKKPADLGTIAGLDYTKILAMGFLIINMILATIGFGLWNAFLKW